MTTEQKAELFNWWLQGLMTKEEAEKEGDFTIIKSGNMFWFQSNDTLLEA